MRTIITATNIPRLNTYLGEYDGIKTLDYDIEFQEELFAKLAVHDPDVLLISEKLPGPLSKYELAEELTKMNKKMKIIFILNEAEDVSFIKHIKEKGIRQHFDISDTDINDELIPAILFDDVDREKIKQIIDETASTSETNTFRGTEKVYVKKEVVTIASPGGGGIGKTTIATNLAIMAAKKYPDAKVLIIDYSEEKADVDKVLNIPGELGLESLKKAIKEEEFNANNILRNIEQYDMSLSNLYVMPGIKRLIDSDIYSLRHYRHIIDVLKSEFDLLIIDTGFFKSNSTYVAIEKATKVIFIIRDSETTISSLKEKLDFYKKDLHFDIEDKIEILMNMTIGYDELDEESIFEIFKKEVIGNINFNAKIGLAMEKYKPFVLSQGKTFKKEIKTLERVLENIFKLHYVEENRGVFTSLKARLGIGG